MTGNSNQNIRLAGPVLFGHFTLDPMVWQSGGGYRAMSTEKKSERQERLQNMEQADIDDIALWFETWDKLVDGVDFVPARELFDDDVIGFGTRMDTVRGLEYLEVEQWRRVWPTIEGFRFDTDTLECLISPDRLQGVGIVVWHSTGLGEDMTSFQRNGRATVVFRRKTLAESWKGVHTHISLNPGTPQRSYGNRPEKS